MKTQLSGAGINETEFSIDALNDGDGWHSSISKATFESKCVQVFKDRLEDPVNRIFDKERVRDLGITKDNINEVVLVGGSTRIPKVQDLIKEYFNNSPNLCFCPNPDEAVA